MTYDARQMARELYDYLFGMGVHRESKLPRIEAALERAYAAGSAAHVEHHRCERCYAAGKDAGARYVAEHRDDAFKAGVQSERDRCAMQHGPALRAGEGG